ncbi:MAG: hypothetical protein JRI77_02575 [Deltaproteobacteria bacterium]|nr:hypothetical protein [Deltaproteobacteria bacterium]
MSRIYDLLSKDKKGRVGLLEGPKALPHKEAAFPSVFELPEVLIDRDSESLKEFRALLRNLLLLDDSTFKSLMICSAAGKSGASTVALNLSVLMARELDTPFLLVEANPFSPLLYRFRKGKPCEGLCQLLEEQRPLENYVLPTTEPRLFAMSVGVSGADHSRIFHPSRLESVFNRLKAVYRTVIIDGPPVLKADRNLQMAHYVDGVMLVVRTGTLAENIRCAIARLEEQQARVLGLVMNSC